MIPAALPAIFFVPVPLKSAASPIQMLDHYES
jgi:hypothetical protein